MSPPRFEDPTLCSIVQGFPVAAGYSTLREGLLAMATTRKTLLELVGGVSARPAHLRLPPSPHPAIAACVLGV